MGICRATETTMFLNDSQLLMSYGLPLKETILSFRGDNNETGKPQEGPIQDTACTTKTTFFFF